MYAARERYRAAAGCGKRAERECPPLCFALPCHTRTDGVVIFSRAALRNKLSIFRGALKTKDPHFLPNAHWFFIHT